MSKAELPPISTRIAHSGFEDSRYCGHSVFNDLAGRESQLGMTALAILGRRLSPSECGVLDDISVVLTEADPRIWTPKTARLLAAYGNELCGIVAGNLCISGAVVGPWPAQEASRLLVKLKSAIDERASEEDTVTTVITQVIQGLKSVPGFGVPFRPKDWRLAALTRCIEERNRHHLPYWKLQQSLVKVVVEQKPGLAPNVGIGVGAACLDIGFEPDGLGPITIAMLYNPIFANALESAREAPGILRRLPDDRVEYVGEPPRKSPRAKELLGSPATISKGGYPLRSS